MYKHSPLILASQSPRRLQLLQAAGFEVKVQTVDVEENYPDSLAAKDVPEYLAHKKVQALLADDKNLQMLDVLGADTIVLLGNKILGKPSSPEDAIATLQQLSGKIHQVITGVCIAKAGSIHLFSSVTDVHFKHLSDTDIAYYVSHFKPFDKAGSYAIQEWIGMIGIEKIVGDYYNVMGLPVAKVYDFLCQH